MSGSSITTALGVLGALANFSASPIISCVVWLEFACATTSISIASSELSGTDKAAASVELAALPSIGLGLARSSVIA